MAKPPCLGPATPCFFLLFFGFLPFPSGGRWVDHLATALPELILPALHISSQLHPLLTRTTTPQHRPREATSIFDLMYKELGMAQIGHGWSRRHQGRQRCSAGGGSAKCGGEQREGWGRCRGCSRLKPHSEIKSEGSTAAISPPLLRAPSFIFKNRNNYEYKETHGFFLQLRQEGAHCVIADTRE